MATQRDTSDFPFGLTGQEPRPLDHPEMETRVHESSPPGGCQADAMQMQAGDPQADAFLRYALAMISETLPTTSDCEVPLELHRKGLRLVPLFGKRALVRDWPQLDLGESDIREWNRRGVNWGILTGDPLVVFDTDSSEAEAWVQAHRIESPVMVRSGGGGLHRYFRCPEHVEIRSTSAAHKIDGLDVKGWHSYIVAAGSIHPKTHERYEYIPGRELRAVHELPEFNPLWVREPRPPLVQNERPSGIAACVNGQIRNVRAYIRGIQSIEGSGGDRACFTTACLLAEAGLTFNEALAELLDWNQTNAFPPWEGKELEWKLRYAFGRVLLK